MKYHTGTKLKLGGAAIKAVSSLAINAAMARNRCSKTATSVGNACVVHVVAKNETAAMSTLLCLCAQHFESVCGNQFVMIGAASLLCIP